MGSTRISRRRAIAYGLRATGAGALAVGAGVLIGPFAPAQPQQQSVLADGALAAQEPVDLPQPKALRSVNGELALTLTAVPGVVHMGAPKPVRTYTYDNVVPGYTWEINPGDTLKIDLVNKLPEIPHPHHEDLTRPHAWTTTNLHTHGLHVSPAGNADNIFLSVAPGETQHYEIPVPKDHPAGTFWYHPHSHGAVAQQLRAGMAGMIVVRGDLDQVAEVRAAKEQVMVLQAIEVGDDFQLLDPIPDPTKTQAFFPRTYTLYTINGRLNPRIVMRPGEVQRWRMLNAAEGKYMSLRLDDHDFNVLAWDGLTLAAPDRVGVVMLSAGNRVDVLVKAGKPGTYSLVLTPGSSQKPKIPGMPDQPPAVSATPTVPAITGSLLGTGPAASPIASDEAMSDMEEQGLPEIPGELEVRPILTIEVAGERTDMALPTALPAWDPPMLPIARKRSLTYTVQRQPDTEFVSFGIDGLPFDPDRPPYRIKLGTAEEWTLTNGVDKKLMDHAHVFHIHTNPFKITKINGKTLATPLWRDTFVLTRTTGDSLTFESNFVDFVGKFVEHCHVVSHEDLGMMESIEVVP